MGTNTFTWYLIHTGLSRHHWLFGSSPATPSPWPLATFQWISPGTRLQTTMSHQSFTTQVLDLDYFFLGCSVEPSNLLNTLRPEFADQLEMRDAAFTGHFGLLKLSSFHLASKVCHLVIQLEAAIVPRAADLFFHFFKISWTFQFFIRKMQDLGPAPLSMGPSLGSMGARQPLGMGWTSHCLHLKL